MKFLTAILVLALVHTLGLSQDFIRSSEGLVLFYTFEEGKGNIVEDRSGISPKVDLEIKGDSNWRSKSLQLKGGHTILRPSAKSVKLCQALRKTNELTLEAWVEDPDPGNTGPARIMTFSKNPNERNFTIGQDGAVYDFRLRTSKGSRNGTPSMSSKSRSVQAGLSQIVFTRDRSGVAKVYINGQLQVEKNLGGNFSSWDQSCQFAIGNELSGDRPWNGVIHLAAVYNRSLGAKEISDHFQIGIKGAGVAETAPARTLTKSDPSSESKLSRTHRGLELLYTFEEKDGKVVKDRSGVSPAVDLEIAKPGNMRRSKGGIQLAGGALLRSRIPPQKLINSVRRSNELTVEAWIERPNPNQEGPARIVTLSKSSVERNFTLGQESSEYDFRLRTTSTSANGLPSTSSGKGKVKQDLAHLVFTRDRTGRTRIYLDSRMVAENRVTGDFSNWDSNFLLAIGDELNGGRTWSGTIHLVALYSRSLAHAEVEKNFTAGPSASGSREATPEDKLSKNRDLFSNHVAPVLANHCVECHDAATQKGDLDLSNRETAFAAIKAGNADQSVLWELVASNEMPHKKDPLSDRDKKYIKDWINGGAAWSVKKIDPANYTFHGGASGQGVRRLTVSEYIATVDATFGVNIEKEAKKILPPDLRADGFSNTSYNLTVDFQHVDAYAKLAREIVQRIDIPAFAKRFSSKRNVNDKDMRSLIAAMGEWVLRGELQSREIDIYRGITTNVVSAGGGFDAAISHVVEAMLQSPRFLYRIEQSSSRDYPAPLSGDELASRMSYIIWGSSPDRELRQKGKSGELLRREVCLAEVGRMLKDRRARQRSRAFASEWLHLDRLENLQPNRELFPKWNPELAHDMRRETLAYFEEVIWNREEPMSNLMNQQFTYLTPALASHYGLKYTGNGNLVRHDLSKTPSRGGILTQGSVLTVGGDEASMVTRGLFVMRDVLRSVVKDPPPCVDTTPVPTGEGLSQRSIAEKRIANKSCGGCHEKFEPLAFGLERFDGLGGYHRTDHHGNDLREDGEVRFPGDPAPTPYRFSSELMNLLANSKRVKETIAWKLTQFSMGRALRVSDLPAMEKICFESEKDGGTYQSLIEAIILSDLVQRNQ